MVSDTQRIKKLRLYSELDKEQIQFFNGRPFYPMPFENSRLYNSLSLRGNDSISNLGLKVFKKVSSIWGYYYRHGQNASTIPDGVIEQWEFNDNEKAYEALKYMEEQGGEIYFNTKPYFCRLRNYLIVFQTRAMAFSFDQKEVFEKFFNEKVLVEI